MTIEHLRPKHNPSTRHVGDIIQIKKSVGSKGYTFLFGPLETSRYRPQCFFTLKQQRARPISLYIIYNFVKNSLYVCSLILFLGGRNIPVEIWSISNFEFNYFINKGTKNLNNYQHMNMKYLFNILGLQKNIYLVTLPL